MTGDAYQDARAIVETLVSHGHVAYFAGGCVRDALLGREPKDYDVATSATPDVVRKLFRAAQFVGAAFGVVLARAKHSMVEVATFRRDGAYTDGRRPDSVEFSDAEHDARRRDFTINGLFFDPLADRVIDFVGGQDDLKAKVIRAIGDPAARFGEDFLRLLRVARFAARLDFAIETATFAAARANASRLAQIAPERIAAELRLMLAAPTASVAVRHLDSLGLSDVILRGLPLAAGDRSRIIQRLPTDASVPLRLAALAVAAVGESNVVDQTKRIGDVLRRNLKLSNDELASLRTILDAAFALGPPPTVASLKRYLALPDSADGLALLRAIDWPAEQASRVADLLSTCEDFEPSTIAPPPFVNGDDLRDMNVSPGPIFKRVLDAVYDAQLEARVTNRADALALAASLARPQP